MAFAICQTYQATSSAVKYRHSTHLTQKWQLSLMLCVRAKSMTPPFSLLVVQLSLCLIYSTFDLSLHAIYCHCCLRMHNSAGYVF